MKTGGQNIITAEEHKAKGNYRPSRHANRMEGVVKPVATPPNPPKDFDKIHADIWVKTCSLLYAHKLLTENDFDVIRIYCETMVLRLAALADMKDKGLTYETETGHLRPNPSIALAMQFTNTLLTIQDRFGFNPKARQALKVGEITEPTDEGMKFFSN